MTILPPVPFPAIGNLREHLYYLRTVYCRILEKIYFKNLDFILSVSKPKRFYWDAK